MKIFRFVSITIVLSLLISCVSRFMCYEYEDRDKKDLDYPYRDMGGLFEGCITRGGEGISFSPVSANLSNKTLIVYNRPYAIAEKETRDGEVPLFDTGEDYRTLCRNNIKAYCEKAGIGFDEDKIIYGPGPKCSYSDGTINLGAYGDRMFLNVIGDYETLLGIYESGDLKSDRYIKAAVEMAGYGDFTYTKTDENRKTYHGPDYDGGKYYIYPADAKTPQPYGVKFEISADPGSETCTYRIEFQKDGYDGYVYGEYKAISYKEAFRRLKNNEYRSSNWDSDLSGISENDVLCELVYTDAIDLHYMMPCYKFYVEVKDEDQLTQKQVSDNEKLYFFYYVPAVDMNENPETGEADPVAAAVCAAAFAVLLAAAQINLKKFRKNT